MDNSSQIKQLQNALNNKHITPELKSKIEDAIKKLQESEVKEPEAEKIVEQKQKFLKPKITYTKKAKKVKPKITKTVIKSEKQTVFSKAKEIRKEGQSWADAQKEAKEMLKNESSNKKDISNKEIKALLALVKRTKSLKGLMGHTDIVRDAKRKALPSGKRISKEGNTYYENRANRTDSGLVGKKWFLENGGNVNKVVYLVPLELIPLSSQLKKITGDSLNVQDFTDENGNEYSLKVGSIIKNKNTGQKFKIPKKIYRYVDGYNLVLNKSNDSIIVYETNDKIADVKNNNLDFSNKKQGLSIDKIKVKSAFDKNEIPSIENANEFYKQIEGKLNSLYANYEDFEDDKNSKKAKEIDEQIKFYEALIHKLERKYEIGGNLAGQLGGGANIPPVKLDGFSGTDYTGLVGETGTLSEGELFEKGGIIVTKISDIPNLQQKVDERKVTYRGLGVGKLSEDFSKTSNGENGVKIKVDGKEYFITNSDFDKLGGIKKIKFSAPNRKFEGGGAMANQQVLADASQHYENYYLGEGASAGIYADGGSLENHGLHEGDTVLKTITGNIQKVKTKEGNIVFVDLANGYRKSVPPMPFKKGGVTFKDKSEAIAKKIEGEKVAPTYRKKYGNTYSKKEAEEVGNKIVGAMKARGKQKMFGGFSSKKSALVGKQKNTTNNGFVQILAEDDDKKRVQVIALDKIGTGAKPVWIPTSEVITEENKMEKGGEVKSKSSKMKAITDYAKATRKDGELWKDAIKRAWKEVK